MNLQFYNEAGILTPLKCGTRFLDKVFTISDSHRSTINTLPYEVRSGARIERNVALSEMDVLRIGVFPNLSTIIIRPPVEHLYSALHTDIFIKKTLHTDNTTSINEERNYSEIIDSTIKFYAMNYKRNSSIRALHWCSDVYDTLYRVWIKNKERVTVVELRNLSSYLEGRGFELPTYRKNEYDFSWHKSYCSVDELKSIIKTNYEKEWKLLEAQIEEATVFYNYLINGELIDTKII